MQKSFLPGLIAGLVAAAIWGGMYVVSKIVMGVISPFTLLVLRLVLGSLSLSLVIFLKGGFSLNRRQFWSFFLVGIIGYGISLGFQFVGTDLSTASNGSLVTSATPILILPFAYFLINEPVTRRRMFAILLASLGVLAVIDPRKFDLTSNLFWGNMALLLAAITWALYSVLVRKVSTSGDLLQASTVMLLGGLPIAIPFSIWELSTRGISGNIDSGIILGVLFLGIVSTAIAMFLWNYSFAKLPANVASLTFFAQPVVGSLLGWYILGEVITPLFIIGGILIAIGIIISSWK